MNICHFMGNLTRDPELRNVGTNGTPVVKFSVACNRKFKRANGESVKETTFVDCEAWDTGAETIARHFKKGDPIVVHCSAKNESYTDKDGNKRNVLKFRVNNFEFPIGNGKPRNENSAPEGESGYDNAGGGEGAGAGDDIPF